MQARGIDPYIATGRDPHHQGWQAYFAQQSAPPAADAPALEKMAYQLRTEIGQAVYRLWKCTVEPVIGIIKEALGFRQFSLRGQSAAQTTGSGPARLNLTAHYSVMNHDNL